MVGSPQIPQGILNRLFSTAVVPSFPQLTITPPFLGKAGIRLSFDGETSIAIPTMTGVVQSPEPYQMATITAALLKTNGLAELYESQRQTNALIGEVTVTTDSPALLPFNIINCSILSPRELSFAGDETTYVVGIRGFYSINNALWGLGAGL
jgi:hypothetical protein